MLKGALDEQALVAIFNRLKIDNGSEQEAALVLAKNAVRVPDLKVRWHAGIHDLNFYLSVRGLKAFRTFMYGANWKKLKFCTLVPIYYSLGDQKKQLGYISLLALTILAIPKLIDRKKSFFLNIPEGCSLLTENLTTIDIAVFMYCNYQSSRLLRELLNQNQLTAADITQPRNGGTLLTLLLKYASASKVNVLDALFKKMDPLSINFNQRISAATSETYLLTLAQIAVSRIPGLTDPTAYCFPELLYTLLKMIPFYLLDITAKLPDGRDVSEILQSDPIVYASCAFLWELNQVKFSQQPYQIGNFPAHSNDKPASGEDYYGLLVHLLKQARELEKINPPLGACFLLGSYLMEIHCYDLAFQAFCAVAPGKHYDDANAFCVDLLQNGSIDSFGRSLTPEQLANERKWQRGARLLQAARFSMNISSHYPFQEQIKKSVAVMYVFDKTFPSQIPEVWFQKLFTEKDYLLALHLRRIEHLCAVQAMTEKKAESVLSLSADWELGKTANPCYSNFRKAATTFLNFFQPVCSTKNSLRQSQ